MVQIIELEKSQISKVSIVCPYYNESSIIEDAIKAFLKKISSLSLDYELILVNDGSIDDSFKIVEETVKNNDKVTLITYPFNKGRGYALRKGIEKATGDIIVTTEVDLSWGEDIVHRIVNKFMSEPHLDCVIASPNLPDGGYKNVSFKRVLISKVGNILFRLFFTPEISMNTGMTRGYKRDVIQRFDFTEDGKEFHLEVLLKLYMLDYRLGEIPAILEWRKFNNSKPKRKSSTKILKVMRSHLKFLFFIRPLRYFWVISLILIILSSFYLTRGTYFIITSSAGHDVTFADGIKSLLLAIFGIIFFGFGIVTEQNLVILKELWKNK